jgi:transmembrane sensor
MRQIPDSEVEVLRREARRWVRELASGEATTADAEELKRWRHRSRQHEAAFVEAVGVWKSLGPGGRTFVERRGLPASHVQLPSLSRRMLLGGGGALAASVAAYAMVRPPSNLWPSLAEMGADYRTAKGEQKNLILADVAVQMNTQTSIAVTQGAGDFERLHLIAGEASFATPPLFSRQLMVLAGKGRTTANRARFDVRHDGSTICVTCLEGEVEVEQGGGTATVGYGRQLRYDDTGLGQSHAVDTGEVTSWHRGYIVFRQTPLSAAIAEVNRYRPGKVMVLSSALGQKEVSGRFRIDRIDEVLVWIERATGATSRSLPGGLIFLS